MAVEKRELLKALRIALRGSGVILKTVPAFVMRMSGKQSRQELTQMAASHRSVAVRKRAAVALLYKDAVAQVVANGGVCEPRGRLAPDFVAKVLGHVGTGLRTDSTTILAYHMIGPAQARSFKLVGVASYGESATEDTEDRSVLFVPGNGVGKSATDSLNKLLRDLKLVELDLLCSTGGPDGVPGLATLLVSLCLVRASQQRRRRAPKYSGCIIDCVNPGMARIAELLGFENVWVRKSEGAGIVKTYMVLRGAGWVGSVGPKITVAPDICRAPGSGPCV